MLRHFVECEPDEWRRNQVHIFRASPPETAGPQGTGGALTQRLETRKRWPHAQPQRPGAPKLTRQKEKTETTPAKGFRPRCRSRSGLSAGLRSARERFALTGKHVTSYLLPGDSPILPSAAPMLPMRSPASSIGRRSTQTNADWRRSPWIPSGGRS